LTGVGLARDADLRALDEPLLDAMAEDADDEIVEPAPWAE
jgi:hypothetical protein